MSPTPYIFNQLAGYIPKKAFDRLVNKYNGNSHVKDYTCWRHLLVMLWAQLTSRRSFRDIEASLRAHADKLYAMGIGLNVSRNNLSHANAKRNVSIYRGLARRMMAEAVSLPMHGKELTDLMCRFSLNGFFAIDSTTVSLDMRRYPWCTPQKGCGGVKLHTMYDILRSVPRLCLVTGHEERDQTFMEDYPYEKGCLYIFDKAYMKTAGLNVINRCGAFFIVRRKKNVLYEEVERRECDGEKVLADQTIRFTSRWACLGYPDALRMVTYYAEGKNETFQFLTNNFELPAETIAVLYKERWQIEMFFKWIKQHLRIVHFYGTSPNAVMIQIYTAITAYCAIAMAAEACGFEGSLYDFSNMVSVSLTERIWMAELTNRYNILKERKKKELLLWPDLFPEM